MNLRLSYLLPCFGLLTAALSGCTDNSAAPVSIDYHQIGFCNTYATPDGVRASKPDEVYVVYKIEAVNNTHNEDFTFLPNRLYIDPAEWGASQMPWASKPGEMQDFYAIRNRRHFMSNDASFAQATGVRLLEPSVISHDSKKNITGYSFIAAPAAGKDRPVERNFKLSYEPQEGDANWGHVDPPVVMNNTNAAETAWPHHDNCQDLALDRLPS
ncbi:hypothetical protein RZS28_17925 [Methylocapsa polymorpha]|uniref:Lipoprotein n=1 Tax=Methylocapsa polymorpha TaxID=3080828 RepID=A0ABZ0HRX3_9HYPH|nr:hypothetical protein RZS28_17925 [Methylocapsa sp. RX1]